MIISAVDAKVPYPRTTILPFNKSDLLNNGFPPQLPYLSLTMFTIPGVPCLVSGPATGFLAAANLFANYTPSPSDVYEGKPHVSDMLIMHKYRTAFREVPIIHEPVFGDKVWMKAPLIHWSHQGVLKYELAAGGLEPGEDRVTAIMRDRVSAIMRIAGENGVWI